MFLRKKLGLSLCFGIFGAITSVAYTDMAARLISCPLCAPIYPATGSLIPTTILLCLFWTSQTLVPECLLAAIIQTIMCPLMAAPLGFAMIERKVPPWPICNAAIIASLLVMIIYVALVYAAVIFSAVYSCLFVRGSSRGTTPGTEEGSRRIIPITRLVIGPDGDLMVGTYV